MMKPKTFDDYGPFNGHPMDPRTEVDDDAEEGAEYDHRKAREEWEFERYCAAHPDYLDSSR
jgi:hypothetical protein